MITYEQKVNQFAIDLRRLLFLSRMFNYSLEWMRTSEVTPTYLKSDIKHIQDSIERLYRHMKNDNPKSWERVAQELDKDRLHDLSLLIDEVAEAVNIEEITEVLKACKVQIPVS